jgi:hypothetical protein
VKQCAVCPAEATGDSDRCAAHAQPARRPTTVTFDEGTEFVQHRRATRPRHKPPVTEERWGAGPGDTEGEAIAFDSDDELMDTVVATMVDQAAGERDNWTVPGRLVSGTTIDELSAVTAHMAKSNGVHVVSAGAFPVLIKDMRPGKRFMKDWAGKRCIAIPFHMVPYEGATGHWAMAVVWPNDREVVWYDSLPGYADEQCASTVERIAAYAQMVFGSEFAIHAGDCERQAPGSPGTPGR